MFTPTKLLTTRNFKTIKGQKYGYTTYILYLAPATENSKGVNLCPNASPGCATACLFTSGFGGMYEKVKIGRMNKSEWYINDRKGFLEQLDTEITAIEKRHLDNIKMVSIRLNGTSDIRYEKLIIRDDKNIFQLHPTVQFYDYTKNPKRFDIELPANYQLTFSRSEENEETAINILKRGFNVAMVFNKVPTTYKGFSVINGDENDLRFLDPKGVIVGLKYKYSTGKGGEHVNKDAFTSGFVVMN
jgi:hypothetical protein